MIPLRIEGADVVMKAPAGQEDSVRDLHVRIIDGCCVSRWEVLPAELAYLIAGGSIELWVQGGQPPVVLRVVPGASSAPSAPPLPARKPLVVKLEQMKGEGGALAMEKLHNKYVRIWSDQHGLWWRPGYCGYTPRKEAAGIFLFQDAYYHSSHCGPEKGIAYHEVIA